MTSSAVGPPAVDRPELVDAEWLTAALVSAGHDVEIRSVVQSPVGTGQMASSYRLELEHDCATLPPTLVAKLPSEDPETRATIASGYRAEIGFYTDIACSVAVTVPACYRAVLSDDGSVFVLLMEDMAPATQGDQLVGATPDEARASVVNLAGLHGPRWCDPTLADIDILAFAEPGVAEFLGELTASAADVFIKRFAEQLSAEDATLLVDAADLIGRWLLARPERFAAIHGDYRMDNVLFSPDGRVTAVDWQTIALGLPARDLAYFVSTSLTVPERRVREDELISAYHECLVTYGVTGYTLDQCRDDYAFAMLHGPLIVILGAAYGARTERGDAMFLAMIERSCQAIRDHGTLDLVRAEI